MQCDQLSWESSSNQLIRTRRQAWRWKHATVTDVTFPAQCKRLSHNHRQIHISTPTRFLANTFAICCRRSVRRLSVMLVHPTQAVVIFRNISTAFGTLAIRWHPRKILRRSSQGNPSAGGVKHKRGSWIYSNFGPIEGYISEMVQDRRLVSWSLTSLFSTNMAIWEMSKIGGRLLLITHSKSYMSFRFVPKLVTLNDLERRNGCFLRYFSEFW